VVFPVPVDFFPGIQKLMDKISENKPAPAKTD
jgi:hypothetical protein